MASLWCEEKKNAISKDRSIDRSGADAYMTNVPLKELHEALGKKGHEVSISNSAGTHLCNYTYYMTLRLLDMQDKDKDALFVHLPPDADVNKLAGLCEDIIYNHN